MNDLIARAAETTTRDALEGTRILGPAIVVSKDIESFGWLQGLAIPGAATDVAGFIVDPIASMASSAASFLMEHCDALSEALDSLAGSPAAVTAQAQTWFNVADRVTGTTTEYASRTAALPTWQGPAATAYQEFASEYCALLEGAGALADGVGHSLSGASAVVGFVRTIVRETIADLVGKLISWVSQLAATAGLASPWVVARATETIAKYVTKVSDWIQSLFTSVKKLMEAVKFLNECLDDVLPVIGRIRTKIDTPIFSSPTRTLRRVSPHYSDLLPSGVTTYTTAASSGRGAYDNSTEGAE